MSDADEAQTLARVAWRIAYATPVVSLLGAFLLSVSQPDCGHATAPPCMTTWKDDWIEYLWVIGWIAAGGVLIALLVGGVRRRWRRD